MIQVTSVAARESAFWKNTKTYKDLFSLWA